MKTLRNLAAAVCLAQVSIAQEELVRFLPPVEPPLPPRIIIPPTPREPDVGPMQTREMAVSVNIKGLHAEVETTILFHNPNSRELEGELIFPLPDGAAVCGYALDINGTLVDGVIVPKEKARVAFETETRRQVDPGLVEHVKGNLYRTRIYPLPAKGERRIRLTYTTPLVNAPNGDAALLLGMPRETIAKLDVEIEVSTHADVRPEIGGLGDKRFEKAEHIWRVKSSSTDAKPGEDIIVALPKLPTSLHQVQRDADGKNWFVISTVPATIKSNTVATETIHVLWDASGSRAKADLTKEFDLIKKFKSSSFKLTVFRDVAEPSRDFKSVDELLAAIQAEPFDGGSDLRALAEFLKGSSNNEGKLRTVLFSDGIDTLSGQPLSFDGLALVAVVSHSVVDLESLRQACAGALIDLRNHDALAAWNEIYLPTPRVTGLRGTGIAQVQGIGQSANGRIKLLGQLTTDEATVQINYADGTLSDPFVLRAADAKEGKVLATAWASARVNQLSPRADQMEDELLFLGKTYGLVSPTTSLIVLETLDQWVRHEIEPPQSLPEMRRQWQAAMKSKAQEKTPDEKQRTEEIISLWQSRVDWWKTDFSKGKPKPASANKELLQNGVGSDPFSAEGAEEAPALLRRPAPQQRQTEGATDAFSAIPVTPATPAADLAEDLDSDAGWGDGDQKPANSSITIKPWDPETPYLKTIRAASPEKHYESYLKERATWSESPAFFLDCADFFYKQGDNKHGRRILSNLAEMRIEEAALLRVFAWRLRQAEELELATVILRRITKLRPEEPQSLRDLALVLADRGRATGSKEHLEEAMKLLLDCALGEWSRHGETISIFALEELNALVAWIDRRDWKPGTKPDIPEYDKRLRQNLDTDIRIIMSWDADATDIDLHVLEPGGEEAYYGNNRTGQGGLVSQDITDGYGPEEYLMRIAPGGSYKLSTKYFASHQQKVVGHSTVTATVFTNWGRPNEKRRTLTIRLDEPKDMIELGNITFGRADLATEISNLKPRMTRDQIIQILGKPADPDTSPLQYIQNSRTYLLHFDANDRLTRITEILPGGTETIIVQ